eukprot:EG_transcript_24956
MHCRCLEVRPGVPGDGSVEALEPSNTFVVTNDDSALDLRRPSGRGRGDDAHLSSPKPSQSLKEAGGLVKPLYSVTEFHTRRFAGERNPSLLHLHFKVFGAAGRLCLQWLATARPEATVVVQQQPGNSPSPG